VFIFSYVDCFPALEIGGQERAAGPLKQEINKEVTRTRRKQQRLWEAIGPMVRYNPYLA